MSDIFSPAPEIQLDPSDCEFANSIKGPKILDLLVTNRCQENCNFCFAPVGSLSEIAREEWLRIIHLSYLTGTEKVTFTGGEPLLLDFLPDLIRYSKRLGLQTTLSTNALLLLQRHIDVIPFLDEIGIPIDGPTPEQNAIMRQPNGQMQFNSTVEAIKLIQSEYPHVEMTIRTLVSALNINFVLQIPEGLKKFGIDLREHEIRWKLYQFVPIGPQSLKRSLYIPDEEFLALWASLRNTKLWCEFSPAITQMNPYILVYPGGDLITAALDSERTELFNLPCFQYKTLGNLAKQFRQTMSAWQQWQDEMERAGAAEIRFPPKN